MAETTETSIKTLITILTAPGATKAFNTLGQLANQSIATRAMIAATAADAKRTPLKEETADLLTDEKRGKAYLRGFYPVYKYLQTNPQPAAEQLNGLISDAWEEITEPAREAENALKAFRQTREYKELRAAFADIDEITDPQSTTSNLDIFYVLPLATDPARFMPGIRAYIAEQQDAGAPLSFEAFTEGTGTEGDAPPAFITILRDMAAVNTAEGMTKGIIRAREKRASQYVIAISKIARSMPELSQYGEQEATALLLKHETKHSPEIVAYTTVTTKGTETLKPEDRSTLNAAITLYEAGNKYFNIPMLGRVLDNRTEGEDISPQRKKAIRESINRLRSTIITMEVTEEVKKWAQRYNLGDVKDGKFLMNDPPLFVSNQIFIAGNGEITEGYMFVMPPAILEHAKETGQIQRFPIEVTGIKEVDPRTKIVLKKNVPTNVTRQLIKEYLLERIGHMKNENARGKDPRDSRKILFQSVYDAVGTNGNKQKQRHSEYIIKCLNFWRAPAMAFISDYAIEMNEDGKTPRAIIIIL